jgi:hypothetical protein
MGLGLLLVVLSVTNVGPALAQGIRPVLTMIVNDSANPVPVTGTVVVHNAGAPELQPFRTSLSISPVALNDQRLLATVPDGKRLVVEGTTWGASAPAGHQFVFGALRVGQLGQTVERLQINPPHVSLSSQFVLQDGSQPTRLYFDAGEEIWVGVSVTTTSNVRFDVMISGYLVDMP